MKSKTSCYDPAISHATLKRFAPLCLLYTIGLILLTVGSVRPNNDFCNGVVNIIDMLCTNVPLCNLVYAAILSQLLMGDLYTPRLSYALYSLPVTLGGWYGTQVILGILSVIPGILLSGCILLLKLSAFQVTAAFFMASAFLSFLFFFGVSLLSSVCAGNRIGMLLIYGIINFGGLFYGWTKMKILCPLLYGIYIPNYTATAAPIVDMCSKDAYTVIYKDVPPSYDDGPVAYFNAEVDHLEFNNFLWIMLAYAVVGCIVIALAMYLLRRRKPECAGDLLAFHVTAPVLLVICSVFCGILFHVISDNFGWSMGYPMLFTGMIVGYYATLMLLRRQVNVFSRKSLLPLAMILLVSLTGITATGLDLFGITYRIPDASQVDQVTLALWGSNSNMLTSSDPDDIALAIQVQTESLNYQKEVEHARPLLERIYGSEEDAPHLDEANAQESTCGVKILYKLKNGKQLQRLYFIYGSFDCTSSLEATFSSPEYVFSQSTSLSMENQPFINEERKFDPQALIDCLQGVRLYCWHASDEISGESVNCRIADADVPGLIDAILKDCEAKNIAQNYIFHTGEHYADSLVFYYTVPRLPYSLNCDISLYSANTNTLNYLTEHGYHTADTE